MQKFISNKIAKACFTLLSLSLLTNCAFAYDDTQLSYLDSVSSSYLYNQQDAASYDPGSIEATFKLNSKPVITNSTAKVNLSLRDSDIRQALRMLADKAGIGIIFDKSVEGKITLDLNNITLNDAFLLIFKTMQLTYNFEANTLSVMTIEASKDIAYTRQNMTVLPVKYVNAENLASFLNSNLFNSYTFGLSNKPVVTANPRTNQLVIFGTNADVMAIKS